MRNLLLLLGAGLFAVTCVTFGGRTTTQTNAKSATPRGDADAAGVAVVELFTSEGCSSCPPADELLAKLVAEARASGRHVYPLAFHVDYWDDLGWRDRFSDAAFSRRQRDYAAAFKSDRVYTPQMIVNGSSEFVGSDAKAARKAIDDALAKAAGTTVELRLARGKMSGTLGVHYRLTGDVPAGSMLNVALVERGLRSAVRKGENAGRNLTHENVVRHFQNVEPGQTGEGEIELALPDGVAREHASVIAYVQAPGPGRVLGAAAADLP